MRPDAERIEILPEAQRTQETTQNGYNTYINIEVVGFLVGKKPFKKGKTINWKNREVFLDF